MDDEKQFHHVINETRVSDAVVVLGAGASFQAGMPLAGQLAPLVWHALDAHPSVLGRVASTLGVSLRHAKEAVGDDEERIRVAFTQIGADGAARSTFQNCFASLNRDRNSVPSPTHTALARLLQAGRVLRVVSLNWDTLLETAFARRYGIDVNAQGIRLWKPHGDCSRPDERWTLPHEGGALPDAIVNDVMALARERPRALVIIGYSEGDDIVVNRLIHPLEERWRVFRVGPNAVGEGAVRRAAGDALLQIADALCMEPDVPGWEFVTFDNPRGIEAAITGERLGPRDVDSCPRLPHFESARRTIDLVHMVDVAGHPGSGRSITLWQLAREFNRQGWQVLRPAVLDARDQDALIRSASNSSWKRVLVLDDMQTFPAHFSESLSDRAAPSLKIISGTTDAVGERLRSVRIPAKVAVETIAKEFRRRRGEVLTIVHRFDSRVGDRYLEIPIERRIDDAAKSDTPWQFAFVLRGGWIHAREQLDALRDFDRADLLFVIVAARQFLSLDAGVDVEVIVADSQRIGRSEQWARDGLNLLRRRGAILPSDPLRCLHIEAAGVAIESALKDRREDTFPVVVTAIRRLVSDPAQPVRGIRWLLEHVLGADAFRYGSREDKFFPPSALEELLGRLMPITEHLARRDAAFLMSRLLWYRELNDARLLAELHTLSAWLNSATGEDAYAMGDLVNNLGRAATQLVESVDPEGIWARVVGSRPSDGYAWGHYLSRLAFAGTGDWRARTKRAIPKRHLHQLTSGFGVSELYDLSELIDGIASYDLTVALKCMRIATPPLQQGFAMDAFDAYMATQHLHRWVLGHGIFGERRPSPAQKKLSRRITDAIRPPSVARGILACRFGDWETYARLLDWVRKTNRAKHREIVAAIDWEGLDGRSVSFWHSPPREFRLLLYQLTTDDTGQPVRSWVSERSDRIEEIDPILSGISPESAIAVFGRGGRVNLAGHNASDWALQTWALARVAQKDATVARAILEANETHIADRLSKLQGIDAEELPGFLRFAQQLDSSLLKRFCRAIDRSSAAQHWPRVFRERAEVRRGARQVLRLVSENSNAETRKLAQSVLATSAGARKPSTRSERSRKARERDRR